MRVSLACPQSAAHVSRMRLFVVAWLMLAGVWPLASGAPSPDSVAILYNLTSPESRKLAQFYAEARNIPAENLIALKMPESQDISRADYESLIAAPLRKEFDRRGWWRRGKDAAGFTVPVINKIQVLVTVRGVPLRIQPGPKPKPPAATVTPPPPQSPIADRNEASVDSELALFGVEGVPLTGVLPNQYYKSEKSVSGREFPFLILTARIDAPTYATCKRMINDAIEIEKTGLWGMAYVDIANKFPQGDQWLETVVGENLKTGIPTVVDRFNDTLPSHYPMRETAFYHGWYDWSVSGPFLNPAFKFRKGAVAMHLHSFSAEQLGNPSKNWAGPLLEKGAAVTIGNVYEPYLHLSHDFGIIHQRLLAGHSWVEACWMAMPAASWQGVVLGDPLYQPFKHLDGTGNVMKEDTDFRTLRAATLHWQNNPAELRKQLDKAANRTGSGLLAEAVGLDLQARGLSAEATYYFRKAKSFYLADADKLRQDFHVIAIDRSAKRKDLAVRGLRDAEMRYRSLPEVESIKGWLKILDPPPPPPANPAK